MPTPEEIARECIDAALEASGWCVQDPKAVNLAAGRGIAIREFELKSGHGTADYMLFADGRPVGVVEAKPVGTTLTGVETQTSRYSEGLPDWLDPWSRPLAMLYESTGKETRFTNRLDPDPRSRRVFTFHRPETLREWSSPSLVPLPEPMRMAAEDSPAWDPEWNFRRRLKSMPPLIETGLWPAQITAIRNLEQSLSDDRPRALIQMATGSGKTFTAISSIYRLIKFGGATRVLFLVDRANLGRQALKEFQQYVTPDDGRKFTELYNVQHLQSNRIDPVARVVITTVQRLFSMLRGDEALPDDDAEEGSLFDSGSIGPTAPFVIDYNANIPTETFDVIFIDECHRSIYNVWRQVLEYFDATLIGLTATPSKQTFGFFNQNLVMEYDHARAVADGVNVDYDIYEIRTRITELGSTVEAEHYVDKRDRLTREVRWEQLDEDLTYSASQLDRDVVAEDQLRTVARTFREKLFSEIMPGRTEVPKTLIFAKDDSHADDIVQTVREEFAKGNDFCQKITYKTSGKPEELLASFRNDYNPRIVVTVDMIATGTDIKPLEIVMFLRAVKSRIYFEQMKGRGVRVINPTDLQAVTRDALTKDRFVLVDCVGIAIDGLIDQPPLERNPGVSLEHLLNRVALNAANADDLSSLASRLSRLDRSLDATARQDLKASGNGASIADIAHQLVEALDPDRQLEAARQKFGLAPDVKPTAGQIAEARTELLRAASAPVSTNPALRTAIIEARRRTEQTIDKLSKDEVTKAGYSIEATDRAKQTVASFEQFIAEHKDDITALQLLYSRPYREGLRLKDVRELAAAIEAPPRSWTPDQLWKAYEALDTSRVRGSGARVLADLISLVRFALKQEDELAPYPEVVRQRYDAWLVGQESNGRRFATEQRQWLEAIRDHIATSLRIERDDFDATPFAERGGLGKFYEVFGDDMDRVLDELNGALAA